MLAKEINEGHLTNVVATILLSFYVTIGLIKPDKFVT